MAQLGTANASSAILAPGAQAQFALNTLQPATTVPPGVSGFSITRTNPDPGLDFDQLSPSQLVSSLFNLLGWTITGAGAFTASGAGLATTPTEQSLTSADGLTPLDPDESDDANWYYQQAIAIAPFGRPSQPAVSPALPAVANNPYNGVGQTGGSLNQITLALNLQDVYGNSQPMPAGEQTLAVPVGYYDVLSGPASWPSLAISYQIGGSPVAVTLDMSMQQTRYIPSASVTVSAAQASITADLQSYTGIFYQLVQPDVGFTLQTTLAQDSTGKPISYPVPKQPILAFAAGAYVYLGALSTLTAVTEQAPSGGLAVSALVGPVRGHRRPAVRGQPDPAVRDAVRLGQADRAAALHHGAERLAGLDQQQVQQHPGRHAGHAEPGRRPQPGCGPGRRHPHRAGQPAAQLGPGLAGQRGRRRARLAGGDRGRQRPEHHHPAAGHRAEPGHQLLPLGENDSFANAASKLGGTVAQLAQANSAVPIFVTDAPLTVTDVLVGTGDTLTGLAAITGVGTVATLASGNAGLANLFAPATTLVVGTMTNPPAPLPSDTLASYATACTLSLDLLASSNAASASFADGAVLSIPGVFANTASRAVLHLHRAELGHRGQHRGAVRQHCGHHQPAQPDSAGTGRVVDLPADARRRLRPEQHRQPVGTGQGLQRRRHGAGTANAATLGVLASKVTVTVSSVPYQTQANDTLNSLVNRFAELNVVTTVADLITALQDVPNLIAPNAAIVPVPPPSPGESIDDHPGLDRRCLRNHGHPDRVPRSGPGGPGLRRAPAPC